MPAAILSGARMVNANFGGANLEGMVATNTYINLASFRSATLDSARFTGSTLEAVNFTGSSLRNADFTDTVLKNVIFEGADLCGARMPDGTKGACADRSGSPVIEKSAAAPAGTLPTRVKGNI